MLPVGLGEQEVQVAVAAVAAVAGYEVARSLAAEPAGAPLPRTLLRAAPMCRCGVAVAAAVAAVAGLPAAHLLAARSAPGHRLRSRPRYWVL